MVVSTRQCAIFGSIFLIILYCLYYQFTVNSKIQSYRVYDQIALEIFTGKPLIPPFIDFDRPYAIAPAHNLSICCISKSMSTLMRGIACSLYDTEDFMANNRSITENYVGRFCERKNELSRMEDVELAMGNGDFTKVAAIRDPVDRFISFYADKCIYGAGWRPDDRCYNCANNITCFLERQYARFVEYAFSENTTLKHTVEDSHSAPLSWSCEFGKYWKEYKVVKLSANPMDRKSGLEELMDILKEQKVSGTTIDFIQRSMTKGKTKHVTYNSGAHAKIQKEIESDANIRQWLRRIYYFDYVLFGFDTTMIDH